MMRTQNKKNDAMPGRYTCPIIFLVLFLLIWGVLIFLALTEHWWSPIVIFFFIITFFIFWYFSHKKWWLNKDFRKTFLDIFFIAFFVYAFLFIGILFYDGSKSLEKRIPSATYEFGISTEPRDATDIRDLQYDYDFSAKRGYITFTIYQKLSNLNQKSNVEIYVPSQVSFKEKSIIDEQGKELGAEQIEIIPAKRGESQNYVTLSVINGSLDRKSVRINLTGDIYPNAIFIFLTNAASVQADNQESIIFNLGDFECKLPCYTQIKNANIVPTGQIIKVGYPETEPTNTITATSIYKGYLEQTFVVNYQYSPSEKAKSLYTDLYLSFIMASLVLLVELLRKFMSLLIY